jgi:hypothetical protein
MGANFDLCHGLNPPSADSDDTNCAEKTEELYEEFISMVEGRVRKFPNGKPNKMRGLGGEGG